MSGTACSSNDDCDFENPQICGGNGVCVCFGGLGFLGPNCDQPSQQSRFNQAGNLLQALFAIVLLLWGTHTSIQLYKLLKKERGSLEVKKKKADKDRAFVLSLVAVCTVGSAFFFFLYTLFQTILAFNPQTGQALVLKASTGDDFSVIVPPGGIFAQFSIASGFLFVVSASVAIALSLIRVAENLKEFVDHYKFITFVTYFKKGAGVSLAILFILKLSLTLSTHVQITQIIAVFILFFMSLLFTFGRISFVNTLNELSTATKDRSAKVISLVTRTATIHAVLNSAMGISALTEFLLFPTAGDIEPGTFNRQVFLTDFFITCALFQLTCDLWYLGKMVKNMENKHTSMTT